jgi:hypothetical protein
MASEAGTGPVFLSEALERLLPHFDNKPHKVASWLDQRHRDGELQLLAGDIVIAPAANPSMLGVVARGLPDGRVVLYVQVRRAMTINCLVWDGESEDGLREHHGFWSYGRTTFETVFPGSKKKRGGGPRRDFSDQDLLVEALVYVGVAGGLPKTVEGDGSLLEKLKSRIGSRCPERSRFADLFGPIFRRIKEEQDAASKKSKQGGRSVN